MSPILFIILAAIVGYLIFNYLVPMLPDPIRTIVIIVLVLLAIYFLLNLLGVRI